MKYENETKVKSYTIKSQGKQKDVKLKWNFAMGLLHGAFFLGGRAFGNPDIILPVFLSNFSTSKILVGLSSSIFHAWGSAWHAPPRPVQRAQSCWHEPPRRYSVPSAHPRRLARTTAS